MGYTIKDFIDSNNFPEMKLISDNSEITREIKRDSDYSSARGGKNFWG